MGLVNFIMKILSDISSASHPSDENMSLVDVISERLDYFFEYAKEHLLLDEQLFVSLAGFSSKEYK